jgi:hypothetical protein
MQEEEDAISFLFRNIDHFALNDFGAPNNIPLVSVNSAGFLLEFYIKENYKLTTKENLQRILHKLNIMYKEYNLKIFRVKISMALKGSEHGAAKMFIYNKVTKQIKEFSYTECSVPHINNNDTYNVTKIPTYMCGTIWRTLKQAIRKRC